MSARTHSSVTHAPRDPIEQPASAWRDALKDFAHRTPLIANLIEHTHDRRRQARFRAHLQDTLGVAVHWHSAEHALRDARECIERMSAQQPPAARKGSPAITNIRAADLSALRDLTAVDAIDASHVQAAARIASVDPADASAFIAYLALFWIRHRDAIVRLRDCARDHIVLHMTCRARLQRAQRSIESFSPSQSEWHLKLVGGGTSYEFDAAESLLEVPADDTYECLPQKIFQGLTLLTLACNPASILKVDDDHRLADATAMQRLLAYAGGSPAPLQFGDVNRTPLPSAHHRAWHFGKCRSAEIGARPLEMPTPLKWAAGSAGYILNRAALWRVTWASLYYARWLDEILYEDVALAEVASKTGIRLVNTKMRRAIGAVSEY